MNLGWGEILLILLVGVLLLGSRRLPELGRALGQAIREFQRAIRGGPPDDAPRNGPGSS